MTTNITESQVTKYSSDDDVVLSVQGVSKKFCRSLKRSLFYGVQDIASELVGVRKDNNQLRKGEFWALQDVSFELKKGESLGLVGANGSGKTTLLRIISGLIKPDTGSVKITGRVAPLIALGAGFNPILTGRENIYVNMSILGLSKEEIDDRFDEVVDFAEIGDALDAPVQTYSSGMAARLGFACAIHTEPDILLIDEVLAVGDLRFRGKCFRKLTNLKKKGINFILVSHNSHHIFQACDFAVHMCKGKVLGLGDVNSVIKEYEKSLLVVVSERDNVKKDTSVNFANETQQDFQIISAYFGNNNKLQSSTIFSGEYAFICINYEANKVIKNVNITLVVRNINCHNELAIILSNLRDIAPLKIFPKSGNIKVILPYVSLAPSKYNIEIQVRQGELYFLDGINLQIEVESNINMSQCLFYQPREWVIN